MGCNRTLAVNLLLCCFVIVNATSCVCSAASGERASEKYTLFASGDTMIGRWVHYHVYRNGPEWMLIDVKELVAGADIAMANLECVVATRGAFFDKGENRPYLYRTRPEMLDILTEVGFDLVVTSNNHAMDYGPDALMEQIELLEAVGIAQVGSGRNLREASSPTYIKVGDIIVAFIGIEDYFDKCAATTSRPGVHHARGSRAILEDVKAPISAARQNADLVVFTPHWGKNWTEKPTGEMGELAHNIIELGVDAILGHSSHHVHGVEVYRDRPIIYDMGTFFFDTVGNGRMRFGAGFVLEFNRDGFTKVSIHPLKLHASRTVRAKGDDLKHILDLVVRMTAETDPDLKLVRQGDILTLKINPPPRRKKRNKVPSRLYYPRITRRLAQSFREKKTNVVFDEAPEWTAGFDPIELTHGVTVTGAKTAEAVRPRCAFIAEVALRVSGPLDGRWVAAIKGVGRTGKDTFVWDHPVADGGWLANLWQKDQIVVDRTLVRPPRMPEGLYELYWRLVNRDDGSVLRALDTESTDEDGYVRIGEILITTEGIPDGPAGLSWNGVLSDR